MTEYAPFYLQGSPQAPLSESDLRSVDPLLPPSGWEVESGYKMTLIVFFTDTSELSVPPGTILYSDPLPPVEAKAEVPLSYLFLRRGTDAFQVEVAELKGELPGIWADSAIKNVDLVDRPKGKAGTLAETAVLRTDERLLRATYLDEGNPAASEAAKAFLGDLIGVQ